MFWFLFSSKQFVDRCAVSVDLLGGSRTRRVLRRSEVRAQALRARVLARCAAEKRAAAQDAEDARALFGEVRLRQERRHLRHRRFRR